MPRVVVSSADPPGAPVLAPCGDAPRGDLGATPLDPSIESLNRDCFCFTLDPEALGGALDAELDGLGLSSTMVRERCPHLFAEQPVFIDAVHHERIARVVRTIESVVDLPSYQARALADAPAVARLGPGGPRGACLGFDFHLNQGRLGLIEINTNAGGAMLNAVLAKAQRACCPPLEGLLPDAARVQAFERELLAMFEQEWRLAGLPRELTRIAIVDEAPEGQYLYPEFLLFRHLFERAGLSVVIVDPGRLRWQAGQLSVDGERIDLVYNRLTDFALERDESAALREAWLAGAVALTPHPRAHALYADKRRLAWFSDAAVLRDLGVDAATSEWLAAQVPRTEWVDPARADDWWARRRELFFKPVAGFGSRATYRGDKLTRRVFQEILQGRYVAQALVAPGERAVACDESAPLKFDLRAYAYDGRTQWLAARLYQGQTTNFRTPGGGFAPVIDLGLAPGARTGDDAAP